MDTIVGDSLQSLDVGWDNGRGVRNVEEAIEVECRWNNFGQPKPVDGIRLRGVVDQPKMEKEQKVGEDRAGPRVCCTKTASNVQHILNMETVFMPQMCIVLE